MRFLLYKLPVWLIPLLWMLSLQADENAPWGRGSLQAIAYEPHNVVYVIATPDVGVSDDSNRGNACRIYLETEAKSFEQILVQSWMPGIIQRFCRMKQSFGGIIHVI